MAILSALVKAAECLGWPNKIFRDNYFNPAMAVQTRDLGMSVRSLLDFQERIQEISPYNQDDCSYFAHAMMQSVILRFRYHFEGERDTNRLDKVSILTSVKFIELIETSRSTISHMLQTAWIYAYL